MTIEIKEIKTSTYLLDQDWSYGDWSKDIERIHLALRCQHDQITYDPELRDMWCPDCENKQLSEVDRLDWLEHAEEKEQE